MKKGLILAAALVLVATSALASSVVNSKHNLNSYASVTNVSQEVCVFCHTPHAANTAVSKAPLWNRGVNLAALNLYNSATLNATFSRPTTVSNSVANSDAPLCLSCHDGSAVTGALFNEPNAGATSWAGFSWTNTQADIGEGTNNLTNDHPIGMVYESVATSALENGGFFSGVATLDFYDGGKMWCSTCHDVHDDQYYPFLATSNTGSALCITCHNK